MYNHPHHINLSWEDAPEHSQSISWRTTEKIREGYVEFTKATASPFFETTVKSIRASSAINHADDGSWYHHSVNLSTLEPGTTYSYRVGAQNSWSEWSEFTTASGTREPFTFLYFGDVQRFIYSKGSRIIRQAILNRPDSKFLLFGGDMVHRGALNKENWEEFFPAAGWIFQNYPMISTPGNHEHNNAKSGIDLSDNWYHNFTFPRNGPKGHEEETFFVDYNNLRVISLNLCRHRYPEDKRDILEWFEDRLKEFRRDWVIVVHHYAMISCKAHENKPPVRFPELKSLYEKYQVPLVLTGHEHVYARGRVDDEFPVYVVSVAGPWQNAFYFDTWIERAGTSLQLFQEITISPDSLYYESKTVLGEKYDGFTIHKDTDRNKTYVPHSDLPTESLIPPEDFENRYEAEIVNSFEESRNQYLNRKIDKSESNN